jgi:hypothetical protein
VSAARALFGEIRFSGHLPVNIRSASLPSAESTGSHLGATN